MGGLPQQATFLGNHRLIQFSDKYTDQMFLGVCLLPTHVLLVVVLKAGHVFLSVLCLYQVVFMLMFYLETCVGGKCGISDIDTDTEV